VLGLFEHCSKSTLALPDAMILVDTTATPVIASVSAKRAFAKRDGNINFLRMFLFPLRRPGNVNSGGDQGLGSMRSPY